MKYKKCKILFKNKRKENLAKTTILITKVNK